MFDVFLFKFKMHDIIKTRNGNSNNYGKSVLFNLDCEYQNILVFPPVSFTITITK